ncbi:nitrilase-related carbon-nitrogen hydrolase [Bradyrhizobium sp. SSUT112]|uniref:nitrilase-related carbon-nitrogen hydrolase n=1 Tax=Bradyrhizobium sp. SSUT112 TaxID=3040604 RepID=UPI00244ADDED|nr:nitrilase-related carbon-nitrogen hydrolase [Bradyrhizobium sp. SSUT112]MDH2357266.1 nitrilase-related carbon-nitrogen hydrolase [Bradyrhizobium sp. SSUT112]
MSFTAAAIQLGPASPTIAETTDRIVHLIDEAGARGTKLATLPELALTPYFAIGVKDVSSYTDVGENDAALTRIATRAKAHGMAVAVPYAELVGGGLFNSMAFFDGKGRRMGSFRKIHLAGGTDPKAHGAVDVLEKRYFRPGNLGFPAFDAGVARIGGLICYDRRFPESYRSLAAAGAQVILAGYASPLFPGGTLSKSRRNSEICLRAGAYTTTSYVLAAGKAGKEDGHTLIGGSLIIAPDGDIIARAKTMGDEVVTGEIDVSRVEELRERWDWVVDLRPEAYRGRPAPA